MTTYTVYPYQTKDVDVPASQSIAIEHAGNDAVKVYKLSGYSNVPDTLSLIGTVQNQETTFGSYSVATTIRIVNGADIARYNVGATPSVGAPFPDIDFTEDPGTLNGLDDTQGGAINITGGTSSTSANAGGAIAIVGGVPGATGVGGAASLKGGAGGSTSGAGGAVSVIGGAGTGAGANGGAASFAGGAGKAHTTGTGGTGGASSLAAGAGGEATGSGGVGGAGGALTISGGAGGAASHSASGNAGAGGAITQTAGVGGAANGTTSAAGGAGGALSLSAGAGGVADGQSAAGAGGAASLTAGAGASKAGTGTASGGAGGNASVTAGAGGDTASNGSDAGGAGGDITFTAGAGGDASAGSGDGGAGGTVKLVPGAGGTSSGGSAGVPGMVICGGVAGAAAFALNVTRSTVADTGTLTAAQHRGMVIYQDASGGNVTCTTLTGAQLDTAFPDLVVGNAIPLYHSSNHATNTSTISGGSNVTLVGSGAVTNTGGQYLTIKTGVGTYDLVRVG